MCDSGPWDRVPFAAAAAAPPSPAVPRHHPNTRPRSTLPGVPLGAGVGGGSRPQRHRSLVVLELGSAHRREPTAGPGPRTIAGRRVAQKTECDKVRVSHFPPPMAAHLAHTVCLSVWSGTTPKRERERERDRNTLSHTRNAVLPSVLPVCKCAGSLPPYYRQTRTRTCTRTAKHQGGADAAWSRLRSSVGKCSVEKPGSGAAGRLPRGAWTLRVWTVAVAVVDQVVFWRLGHTLQSASECRAGPVASVRKRRRRVPFSGKICRRRAWHRGERWVDGGAAFPRLGLSCLFFFSLSGLVGQKHHQTDLALPRRGPVVNGGDEANPRAKVSAGICCPRHRCWRFPALCTSVVVRPLF